MFDLGECLSLDMDNLPSVFYLSPEHTPPPWTDGYFMFDCFGLLQTQIIAVAAQNANWRKFITYGLRQKLFGVRPFASGSMQFLGPLLARIGSVF